MTCNTPEEFLTTIKNTNEYNDKCSVSSALNLICGKWELKILFLLLKNDVLRFGEIKKEIPEITNTVLTSVLKKLEKAGIVNRTQYNEIPPHVEYSLTSAGQELLPIFFELGKWGSKFLEN